MRRGGGAPLPPSGEVERARFAATVRAVWPLVIAHQPVRAALGVYGPLLVATQSYVFWGKAVAGCVALVW